MIAKCRFKLANRTNIFGNRYFIRQNIHSQVKASTT